ncbi:uncharacterized protein LOC106997102 [Macaca mulatta]
MLFGVCCIGDFLCTFSGQLILLFPGPWSPCQLRFPGIGLSSLSTKAGSEWRRVLSEVTKCVSGNHRTRNQDSSCSSCHLVASWSSKCLDPEMVSQTSACDLRLRLGAPALASRISELTGSKVSIVQVPAGEDLA